MRINADLKVNKCLQYSFYFCIFFPMCVIVLSKTEAVGQKEDKGSHPTTLS